MRPTIIGFFGGLLSLVSGSMPTSGVRYLGRFDFSQPSPRADWSGSGISFFVSTPIDNSAATISLGINSTATNFVGVLINCAFLGKFEVSPSTDHVEFSFDPVEGETYEISVVKLTEANQGIISFFSLGTEGVQIVSEAGLQSCRNKSSLNLLFIGDSITAAYGVEGVSPCDFSPDTENILDSYATLVANDIGAEVHTVAWSGKGVVRNYGDENTTSVNPMPVYYNRTIGELEDDDLFWDPTRYKPDAVVVMLGANDYSTEPNPSDEDFITGLVRLLTQIYTDYPNAKVAAMCSAGSNGNQCVNIEKAARITSSYFLAVDDSVYVSYGCDGHPSIETQKNIASYVTPVVKDMLGLI